MDPGKDSSDPDAAEQQPFVNTGSEFRTTKPRSATTRSRHSFATTGLGIVSTLFGGVAGICIAIVILWTIWEIDPWGIINREQIAHQPMEGSPWKDKADEPEPEPEPELLPIPDEDARKEAQALLDDLFGVRYLVHPWLKLLPIMHL